MNDLKQAQVLLATAERDMSALKGMGDSTYAVRFRYSVSDHDATPLSRSLAVDRVSRLLDVVRSMMADLYE